LIGDLAIEIEKDILGLSGGKDLQVENIEEVTWE
jgi:hypothetical protein